MPCFFFIYWYFQVFTTVCRSSRSFRNLNPVFFCIIFSQSKNLCVSTENREKNDWKMPWMTNSWLGFGLLFFDNFFLLWKYFGLNLNSFVYKYCLYIYIQYYTERHKKFKYWNNNNNNKGLTYTYTIIFINIIVFQYEQW